MAIFYNKLSQYFVQKYEEKGMSDCGQVQGHSQ